MAVIESGSSTDLMDVTTQKEARVALTQVAENAGFVRILDSDSRSIATTENGALLTSQDSVQFFEQVDGSSLNTNKWITSTSSMAIAQTAGFITLNSGAATTANAYAILTSIQNIPLYGHLPVRVSLNLKINVIPQSNLTIEFGLGLVATNAAPTDGAFFRYTPASQFQAVINYAGSETAVTINDQTYTEVDGTQVVTPPVIAEAEIFELVLVEDLVQFYVGDVLVKEVEVPVGVAYPTSSGRLPVFFRVFNGASVPSTAPQISIGQVVVAQQSTNQQIPWYDMLASVGLASYQHPVTFGQTANHVNSTSPSSATLSNTAAGYTTLGGRFQFAAVASAATDFALFAYQVPAGYQLRVSGINICTVNTGAIGSAITPTILDWSVGVNASAVSLATADGTNTWAPRRIPLGMQVFGLTSVISAQANDVEGDFTPFLVVDSLRYLHVIVQVPLGAATASQIFRGTVTILGVHV